MWQIYYSIYIIEKLLSHLSMGRLIKQFLPFFVVCSMVGVVGGEVSASVDNNHCNEPEQMTTQCLQTPRYKMTNNMGIGFYAGIGAAIAISMNLYRKKT